MIYAVCKWTARSWWVASMWHQATRFGINQSNIAFGKGGCHNFTSTLQSNLNRHVDCSTPNARPTHQQISKQANPPKKSDFQRPNIQISSQVQPSKPSRPTPLKLLPPCKLHILPKRNLLLKHRHPLPAVPRSPLHLRDELPESLMKQLLCGSAYTHTGTRTGRE